MKNELHNFVHVVDLFRKVISALSCIEKTTNNTRIQNISCNYLQDIIIQYENYRSHKDVNKIEFRYSEAEIVNFSNDCYDNVDVFTFAEDLEFGYNELIEIILKERGNKNG